MLRYQEQLSTIPREEHDAELFKQCKIVQILWSLLLVHLPGPL